MAGREGKSGRCEEQPLRGSSGTGDTFDSHDSEDTKSHRMVYFIKRIVLYVNYLNERGGGIALQLLTSITRQKEAHLLAEEERG